MISGVSKKWKRIYMEACGIDAFKTVRNAGYEVEVLTSPHEKITFFGLLLLE
ncbi:MAG: DUF2284 domain-containing protein [Methanosarcinales archaeon]